jgi:hypothetical protein
VLYWIAPRLPSGINSDHLTALGLLSMFFVGVCFAVSEGTPAALFGVVFFLALNWFGDSLDGTLARVRGHQRPRYGFYVDHILDTFGALFVLGGLAISGAMTPIVAAAFLVAYYLLSIEIYPRHLLRWPVSDVVLGLGAHRVAHPPRHRRTDAAGETDGDDFRLTDAVV